MRYEGPKHTCAKFVILGKKEKDSELQHYDIVESCSGRVSVVSQVVDHCFVCLLALNMGTCFTYNTLLRLNDKHACCLQLALYICVSLFLNISDRINPFQIVKESCIVVQCEFCVKTLTVNPPLLFVRAVAKIGFTNV